VLVTAHKGERRRVESRQNVCVLTADVYVVCGFLVCVCACVWLHECVCSDGVDVLLDNIVCVFGGGKGFIHSAVRVQTVSVRCLLVSECVCVGVCVCVCSPHEVRVWSLCLGVLCAHIHVERESTGTVCVRMCVRVCVIGLVQRVDHTAHSIILISIRVGVCLCECERVWMMMCVSTVCVSTMCVSGGVCVHTVHSSSGRISTREGARVCVCIQMVIHRIPVLRRHRRCHRWIDACVRLCVRLCVCLLLLLCFLRVFHRLLVFVFVFVVG
jgi:hypothetical protein